MSAPRRFAAGILLIAILCASSACAETARITFILVNDIYLMADQMLPDGERRGGFARLAAVVKAERARGANVIVAHAGDTLSPSLMSGLDRGERILTLTNLIAPDIFVPGNHEFDFGKATFLQRMAEAKFPRYAANLRGADGGPLPNFKDRSITTIDGAINGTEQTGRRSGTWWPQFRIIDTATVTPDPEVAAVVAKYEGELGKELDDALGTTAVALDSRTATVRTREAAIGNLVADAMRASTHADAAVTNGGGIRGGKVYPPGAALTARDVLTELPFDN